MTYIKHFTKDGNPKERAIYITDDGLLEYQPNGNIWKDLKEAKAFPTIWLEEVQPGMSLQECKDKVAKGEKDILKQSIKIFYPDPCNENDCAQCGKPKDQHSNDLDGKPFFCESQKNRKEKSHYILMDMAAELYLASNTEKIRQKLESTKDHLITTSEIGLGYLNKYEASQQQAQALAEALERIGHLCGTVNFSAHNQLQVEKQAFEESRLTHPMVGFKHDTFEEYLIWKGKQ